MSTCADIEFKIDKVSKTDLDSSSYRNVGYTENNQNDLQKNSFFRLDPNWGKKLCLTLLRKYYRLHISGTYTITDECAVPLTDNSTHERIRQNISLESPMESKNNLVQFMQESCKIYKRIENTSKRILKRIFKRMCRNTEKTGN